VHKRLFKGYIGGIALIFCLSGLPAQEGDEATTPPPQFVTLITVKPQLKKDVWKLRIVAKAPQLPEKSRIDFLLRWRTKTLATFTIALDGSRRIDKEVELKNLKGFVAGISLNSEIAFSRQPREVILVMEKDPETYPVARSPWRQSFYRQRFDLGSPVQIEGGKKAARTFFQETLKVALSRERIFSEARKGAAAAERFQKDGSLDGAKWQAWVKAEVRDPLRTLQKQINGKKSSLEMLPQARDLGYLREVVNAVAKRSFDRSRSLYSKMGLSADPRDLSPEKIDINCRSTKSSNLQKTVERLCESQGILLTEVSS